MPTITALSGIAPPLFGGVTPVFAPVIGGKASPGEALSITDIYIASSSTVLTAPTLLGTTVADADGNWSFTPPTTIGYRGTVTFFVYDGPASYGFGSANTVVSLQAESTVLDDYTNILGRPADQAALAVDEAALYNGSVSGPALASSLATSSEAQAAIARLYKSELGRGVDPAGNMAVTQSLATGGSLAAFATALARSPEAQAAIAAIYQRELGRAPDFAGATSATQYLAAGGSLAALATNFANSAEAQADLYALYQAELGRPGDLLGIAGFTQALASGSSLADIRTSIAATSEAQSALAAIYVKDLGRQPDVAGLAGNTQFLANGGSLTNVGVAFARSGEVVADINNAYQAATGHTANAVEIAAGQSELLSGLKLASVQSEIAAIDPAVYATTPAVFSVTPQSLGSSPPRFVYSLGSNDALISGGTSSQVMMGPIDNITGFNAAVDVIQVQVAQAPNFAALQITSNPSGSTDLFFLGQQQVLISLASGPLTAKNFVFV